MANENIIDISPDLVAQVSWEDILKANNPFGFYAAAASGSSSSGAVSSVNDGLSPIARDLQSTNFQSGIQGWRLGSNGVIEASDGIFRGSITATSGTIGGWSIGATTLSATGITLDAGNKRISLGTSNEILLDGTNKKIVSSNYSTGVSGFYIDSNLIEAENIIARGTLRGTTFSYDVINAVGGQLIVANADALASDMTAQDSSTMTIKGDSTFAVNDILVIRGIATSGIQEEWFRVTNAASAPTYTVTRDLAGSFSANANPAWKAGTPVVKQGSSDGASTYSGGWLKLIGEGTNSPYYSVLSRTGVNYNAYTEKARLGNLNGFLGFSTDTYGLAMGDSTHYLTWDGTEIDATGFSLTRILTAGETITGATLPVPVFILPEKFTPSSAVINATGAGADTSVVYGANWASQSFTVPFNRNTITGLDIKIKAQGSLSPMTFYVDIYAADANGKPTGSALGTSSMAAVGINTSTQTVYNFSFTPITVSPKEQYAIVIRLSAGDGSNYVTWNDGTAITDEVAFESTNSGSTWSSDINGRYYVLYAGYENPGTVGRVYESDSTNYEFNSFNGFATSTGDAGDSIKVQTEGIVEGFTGLAVNKDYYVNNTTTYNLVTCDPSSPDTKNFGYASWASGSEKVGQSFTVNSIDYNAISNIKVYLRKSGTPTDDIRIKIYGDLDKTTVLATSDAVNASTLDTGSFTLTTFTFSTPYTMVPGSKYFFEVVRDTPDDTLYLMIYFKNSDAYTGGSMWWYDSSNGWVDYSSSNYDLNFYINTEPEDYNTYISTACGDTEIYVGRAISSTQLDIEQKDEQFIGSVTIAKNQTYPVPYGTRKILIKWNIGNNGSYPMNAGQIFLYERFLTTESIVFIESGPNTFNTTFTWANGYLTISNDELVSGTAYFLK